MTPTSDERREVAARLREDASCSESSPRDVVESYLGIEYDGADVLEESYKSESLLRLADLIDPTCHIAPDDWASQQCMGPMLSCDRCQAAFPEINFDYEFCPHCGARVVSHDDNQ